MIRHRPAILLTGADWGFALSPGNDRGLVLAVAHGGNTLHIPVSAEEAQAAADLAAAFGGQITWVTQMTRDPEDQTTMTDSVSLVPVAPQQECRDRGNVEQPDTAGRSETTMTDHIPSIPGGPLDMTPIAYKGVRR